MLFEHELQEHYIFDIILRQAFMNQSKTFQPRRKQKATENEHALAASCGSSTSFRLWATILMPEEARHLDSLINLGKRLAAKINPQMPMRPHPFTILTQDLISHRQSHLDIDDDLSRCRYACSLTLHEPNDYFPILPADRMRKTTC